jgi:hypothetical protein
LPAALAKRGGLLAGPGRGICKRIGGIAGAAGKTTTAGVTVFVVGIGAEKAESIGRSTGVRISSERRMQREQQQEIPETKGKTTVVIGSGTWMKDNSGRTNI